MSRGGCWTLDTSARRHSCGCPAPIPSMYTAVVRAGRLVDRARRQLHPSGPVFCSTDLARGHQWRGIPGGAAAVHTEAHMKDLGIELPEYQDAVWSYVKAQRDGDKLYIGDHVGQDENAVTVRGKVGEEGTPGAEVTPEEAEQLARNAGLRLLSTVSHYLDGNLDRVDQVIKVVGIVNGTPDFRGHGKVVNGCSDLLVEVLGDRGRHARTCTGSGSLPAAVTVEMVVRVKDE